MNIEWKGSPNFDSARKPIDRLVIHWFGSGTLESANSRFQKANDASAHYGISNGRVWQWVEENKVAYHAGNYPMNQRSIGIEHDALPTKPLSELDYETSSDLITGIVQRHPGILLDRDHIIGHKEVKATQCPGTIDIDKLIDMVKRKLNPTSEIDKLKSKILEIETRIEALQKEEIENVKRINDAREIRDWAHDFVGASETLELELAYILETHTDISKWGYSDYLSKGFSLLIGSVTKKKD